MVDPIIKRDPDSKASPGIFSDEDIYEDAGDLEFNPDPAYQRVYLARVPKYIWDAWQGLDDDSEIQVGTIRQCYKKGPKGEPMTSLHMLLRKDIAQHQNVPKEYNLEVTEKQVKNTFIFTEQDLPGFKSRTQTKFDPKSANMPARLVQSKSEKFTPKGVFDPNKRFQPYFRKAVPKRTTMSGRVAYEVNCIAVHNEEAERLLALRTIEAMKPKRHTTFLNQDISVTGKGFIQPGSISAQNSFSGFIVRAICPDHVKTKGVTTGARPQLQKTARIPQNELLDRIFECFRKYNYWSMKAFRAELQQPEAYLRETLEKVAVLAKSGKFATLWSLKSENKINMYEDTIAPTIEGDPGGEESDLDDENGENDVDVKYEDVA
ncbi:Transcription initiation factor IIF subunit beta [Golovinomyces cichoracearum]|uniref:Transcription initiation factor IIF subunit beta n=1 Tax=Golovinomyces cichoracearum TaxID=62708 RepID=A0A420ISK4_9PEZI|nr:Transcription initiation factor IIF subunit beta [Golovinomyces cichoracearum]